jgi:AmmeMemoRadiSam system protein A/AmmeMemoRadiSam system protein B
MGNESAIVFSGIAPHPPIMVPEVGGPAIAQVRSSIAAMENLTQRIVDSGAETVVLITPHAPLDATAFVTYYSPTLYGDFANFRAPATAVEFPLDQTLLDAISKEAARADYEVMNLEDHPLDHGSAVPLYFLDRYGWKGNLVALGYSFLSDEDHVKFGACIRSAADSRDRPIAFVASGDLSHRLKPDAPAGFNPAAHRFDDEVVNAIQENSAQRIGAIDHDVRRIAGECGYRSMLIALGATKDLPGAGEVLSYEAPFGVGYLVAQLTNAGPPRKTHSSSGALEEKSEPAVALPALAREAVETFVRSGKQVSVPHDSSGLLSARAACFVSIKTAGGDLRGCIGTIEPARESLGEEIIANAISAATRDPRFDPVSAGELEGLRYSVDILSAPEPATMATLDPAVYGVIVKDESGLRRGLLLPAIEGIDTVAKQVEIASRKAGIGPDEPVELSRFRVDRFREQS